MAYNPEDVTEVWLIEKGRFIPFALIESRFTGKTLEAAQTMQKAKASKNAINSSIGIDSLWSRRRIRQKVSSLTWN